MEEQCTFQYTLYIIPGHQKVFCKIKQLSFFFFFNVFKNFMEKKFKPPFCKKDERKL